MDQTIPTREELAESLKTSVQEVHFVKANGDKRIMRCTLLEEYLPAPDPEKEPSAQKKEPDPDHFVVWDLAADAWRSFRYERVEQVEPYDLTVTTLGNRNTGAYPK